MKIKEIVVISGKGGTGKTSITASFAVLEGENCVIADCDVDAADMHLLLQPDFKNKKDFYSGKEAVIDPDACINCGKCDDVCHFDSIYQNDVSYYVEAMKCEGCKYCYHVCPTDAIKMVDRWSGNTYISTVKTNAIMVHAKLGIGSDNSGKLVAEVKGLAKQSAKMFKKEYIIVDGSPGVGCPVLSSLSGAKFVVFVTEPTVSGVHDLKRVNELVKKFKIKSGCIINKSDLNTNMTEEIKKYLEKENIMFLAEIPYHNSFKKSLKEYKTIVEYEDLDEESVVVSQNIKNKISEAWHNIKEVLQ
jgi:MinD superfamily P-loop ATPase